MLQGTFYSAFDSLPATVEAVGWLLIGEHMRVLQEGNLGAADQAEFGHAHNASDAGPEDP